jgi:hypothetical protein
MKFIPVPHGTLRPAHASGIHVPQRWEGTKADRDALVVTALDEGGIFRETTTGILYSLAFASSPPTWMQVSNPGARAFAAQGPIGGHRMVRLVDDHSVAYASCDDASNIESVYGMTLGAAVDGDEVWVALRGSVITESSWNWTVGAPIFLGLNGNPTQTIPPTATVVLRIGVAVTLDTMMLRLWQPILL